MLTRIIFCHRLNYILLYLAFLPLAIYSQNSFKEANFQFKNLKEKDGLANNLVHCAIMDNDGFMWLGTQDGLSKWDGLQFKNYFSILDDSTTLAGSMITDIAKDKKGNLWLVSHQGDLCRYNPKENIFKTFSYPAFPNGVVISSEQCIFIDSEEIIWIGSFDDGIIRFDPEKGEFKQFNLTTDFLNEDERFRKNSVFKIIEDISNSDILWLAGNNGLYRMNKKTAAFTHYPSTRPQTENTAILSLIMDHPDHIWLGTYSGGIVKFEVANANWTYFVHDKESWNGLNSNHNIYYDLARKSDTELWVASQDAGAGILNTETGEFSFFKRNQDIESTIGSNNGYKVYVDPEGRVWWLYRDNGASYLDSACQLFEFIDFELQEDYQNATKFISDIEYDAAKNIIYTVGISKKGCFAIDWTTKEITPILTQEGADRQKYYNTILKTKSGQLLVGSNHYYAGASSEIATYPSLFYLDEATNSLIQYLPNLLKEVHSKNVNTLLEDDQQHLWIGTDDGHLYQYDPFTQQLQKYALQDFQQEVFSTGIIHLIKDPQRQQLLLATTKGIYSFHLETKKFSRLKGTDNFSSRSIALRSDGVLWIGTRQIGVQAFDLEKNQLISLQHLKDKPRTPIEKVFFDQEEQLWVTTEKGLCYLHDSSNAFYLFNTSDGLVKNYFYSQGIKVLPSGEILLGQQGGLYIYRPAEIKAALQKGAVAITDIRVNGEEYPLASSSHLYLKHDQNALNISYSALSYCLQNKINFMYKMEGLDKNWILPPDNQNRATYIGIPNGDYIFKVKKIGNEGNLTCSIPITIYPPFWKTWWAFLVYFVLLLLALYLFLQLQLKQQLERAEAKRIKELDTFKTQFYTNITHEFRTPLTIISGMAEQIQQQPNVWLTSGIKMIQRNSNNLLNLINQMLDLQKLEMSTLPLKMIQGDVIAYLKYLLESFQSYADYQNIQAHFLSEEKELIMDYDPDKLMQIVSNLISNAVKFTPKNGHIYMQVRTSTAIDKQANLEISIRDTGVGISEEKLPFIFDRFYQADDSSTRQAEGTGIGLALTRELIHLLGGKISVESIERQGTAFNISLPIHNESIKKESLPLSNKVQWQPSTSNLEEQIPIQNQTTNEDAPLVLIIEDNADVRFYLTTCLKDDFQLIYAENGKVGIEKAMEQIPDIIISDVMMPEMDGFQVCDTLKKAVSTSHIPIILLTAKATIDDKIRGLKYGADAYLAKPFHPRELLVRLDKLIENRKRLQAIYSKGQLITEPTPKTEDVYLQKVQEIILENLDRTDFGPSELAVSLDSSRSQLHRKLKALTDINTSKYINTIRLQEAKKLLKDEKLNISEIAYAVGFSSPQYFSRRFTEVFECSPTEYREGGNA